MNSFIEIFMKPKSLLYGPDISEGKNERNLKPLLYHVVISYYYNESLYYRRQEIIENYDYILSSVVCNSMRTKGK